MAERRDEGGPGADPPSRTQFATWALLGGAALLVLVLFSVRGEHGPDTTRNYPSRTLPPEPAPVLIAAPEMDDEYWPCSDCHEDEPTNPEVRKLEDEHDAMEFKHGTLWCLDCHDAEDRDSLHLADRSLVSFSESWRLCTRCHGQKLADWRAGVHGKRTGHWWGPKEYRPCVACHNPHSPPFAPLEPKPIPLRPEQIRMNGSAPMEVAHE